MNKTSARASMADDPTISEIEFLRRFCALNTSTLDKEGVGRAQDLVSEKLESLGFKERRIRGEDRFAELIVSERPGRRKEFITIITHTDTVLPNESEFRVDEKSGQAFGSGVIDNKGGVVVGLSATERFLKRVSKTEFSLRWICSPNEEMGSIGFTEIYRELGGDTVAALGLEPALDDGSIIHQRRGNRWYDIEISGREAHAGRSRGQHANAAHDMAVKVVKLARLTNYKKDVSVNVGHVEGGKGKHNIICGRTHVKLDVRFPSHEAREILHKRIHRILHRERRPALCGELETEINYSIVDDCPPFSLNRRSKRMAKVYSELVSDLEGRKVKSAPSGGAGDVNYLSGPRKLVLDGLGPIGGGMHTSEEFVRIDSLASRALALASFLQHLQTAKFTKE